MQEQGQEKIITIIIVLILVLIIAITIVGVIVIAIIAIATIVIVVIVIMNIIIVIVIIDPSFRFPPLLAPPPGTRTHWDSFASAREGIAWHFFPGKGLAPGFPLSVGPLALDRRSDEQGEEKFRLRHPHEMGMLLTTLVLNNEAFA